MNKELGEMDKEERAEYFESLGVSGKKVEESEAESGSVPVIEEESEEDEEHREKELEQYREEAGF